MLDQFDRAEGYFKRAIDGFERTLGQAHPDGIGSACLLGIGHLRRGMMSEAGPHLERASQVRDRVLGPKHPASLYTAVYLGFYYDENSKGAEATPRRLRVHENRDKLADGIANSRMPHWARVCVGTSLQRFVSRPAFRDFDRLCRSSGPSVTPKLLTPWLPLRDLARRRVDRLRLGVEQFADRLAHSAGLPPDIVVGRTQSAYSTLDVQHQ